MTRGRPLAVLLLCLMGTLPAAAQPDAHLAGVILDASGAGIPGALVTVVNEDTGFRRVVWSQLDGGYVVASLRPGLYKITVRKEGFRTVVRFGFRLEAAHSSGASFTLPVGSIQETITVEGTASPLHAEDASVSTLVERDAIERLPLNGRGLLSLLELAPGTLVTPATRGEAGQFTTNGQRPNTHDFTVDGVSANTGVSAGGVPAQPTGGALPGLSAFGSLHSLISMEALQEFRVETSTASPEFGRLPGASVILSSRSGSNAFHGSLLFGFRNERADANDWFANSYGAGRKPLRLSDAAPAVGGPVLRNRTFFFLSYEGLRLRQPFAWRTPVPSAETLASAPEWMQPVFNLYPAPNGPDLGQGWATWTGRNNRPSRLDVASLRIDHAVTSRLMVFARYSDSPSTNEFGGTQINRLQFRSQSATLGVNLRPRGNLVLDLRVNIANATAHSVWQQVEAPACAMGSVTLHFLRTFAPCDYLVRFSIAGAGTLMAGSEGARRQRQFQLFPSVTFTRGGHSLRFGADYRRLAPSRHDSTGSLSVIADSLNDLVHGWNLWVGNSAAQSGTTHVKEFSVLAQDTWRVTSRLTATYGVRWELDPAPAPSGTAYYLDPEKGYAILDGRPVWRLRYRNFAPRLGVAWQPGSASRTVVRAGAGLYYDSSLSIATDLINNGPLNMDSHGSDAHAPFSMLLRFGFLPDLRLPVVKQWSASVEHAFDDREVVAASYVGSSGRRLMRRELGGLGSSQLTWMALATNHGSSDYHGLQAQYRRRLAKRVQALASYAWSHSIDDSSTDAALYWTGSGLTPAADRGSSDFDVRHTVTAAVSCEVGRGWALDGIFRARTGFPITVLDTDTYMGLTLGNVFRPDLVGGAPVWVNDPGAPGGRRLNPGAFAMPAAGSQGNLGRNAVSGLSMSQIDLAARRQFSLGEKRLLELRIEAFNAFNQANFADPVRFLSSPLFGQSTSMLNLMLGTGSPGSGLAPIFQTGGVRSLQLVVRLRF